MTTRSPGPRRLLLALAPVLAFPAAAFAQCPSVEQVEQMNAYIQQIIPRPPGKEAPAIETKKITPSVLKGLCEVQVKIQGRPIIYYADEKGVYFVLGNMIETKSRKNLTEVAVSALNVISPEDMKKVEGLVAMTLGDKGKPVYFVTDPQ